MKKKVDLLGLLFFLSFVSLNAQMSYFYKGEKIPLTVDRNYVHVIADENFIKSSNSTQLFRSFNLEQSDSKPVEGLVKLRSKSKLSVSEYSEMIKSLKQNEQIKHVFPFFERGNADPIGTSDVFYLKLKETRDITLLKNIAEQQNVQIVKQVPYMPLWYILSMQNSAFGNSIDASNYFYETGYFDDVDPAFMFNFKTKCTNDTQFNQLWGLENSSNPAIDINACCAWTIARGAGVNVAVVDQGIDPNHNDLSANLHPLSFDAQSGASSSFYIPMLSHGTHVAGTIAAVKDNNLQVVGVAPEAKIMGVSHWMMLPTPTYSAELASGISWAWQNGADVINNSWGDEGGSLYGLLYSSILENAIINAIIQGRGGKGAVVVFASGDYASSSPVMDYPGNFYYDILTVGSINESGQRSVFNPTQASGYGPQLDVVAPGSNILSTVAYNGTSSMSGTSMAAAHVSGVAALLLSAAPNLTGQQVRNIIESTAKKVGGYSYTTTSGRPNGTWNNEMGYGLVDACAALQTLVSDVKGTVFPFVHTGNPTLDALFPVTARLYAPPPIPCRDPILYLYRSTHKYETTAVYYDGSDHVPGTPMYPGTIGNPDFNNPGEEMNWGIINKTPASSPNNTPVSPGSAPTAPVGLFHFQGVIPGEYVLVLSRDGYVPRFAKITVPPNDTHIVGHREIVGGDVDRDLGVDVNDLNATHYRVGLNYLDTNYEARYDVNGDGLIDSDDITLIRLFQGFHVEGYMDTYNWRISHW